MNRSATKTIAVETAAPTYSPAPQAIPIAATTHTVAALVSPSTRFRVCRISPAPRNPMPCTMFDATRLLSVIPGPASTPESTVNSAHPMHSSMLVRRPEALCRHSRSTPIRPPIAHAISRRMVVPCENAICSIVLK